MKTTKALMIFVLFFAICALPAGAATVIDATGQTLGTLLDTSGPDSLKVFISSSAAGGFNGVAVLDLNPGKAQGTIGWNEALSAVWYESVDCTGSPYAAARAAAYPILSSIGGKYVVLDYKNAGTTKTMTPQSALSGMGCMKIKRAKSGTYYPVVEITATALPFTLPVTTPLHFQ